jgi:hypothetical protein
MDRSHREWRPGASVLAPEISWSHTLRLLLMGIRKRSSLCTISTNNIGRPKNRIRAAVNSVMQDNLLQVWDEFSCLDVVRAAGGGHIGHLLTWLWVQSNVIYIIFITIPILKYSHTKLGPSFLIILYYGWLNLFQILSLKGFLYREFIATRQDVQNVMYPSHFFRNRSGMIETSILETARADTRAAQLKERIPCSVDHEVHESIFTWGDVCLAQAKVAGLQQ